MAGLRVQTWQTRDHTHGQYNHGMDVFRLRDCVVDDYRSYVSSFIRIRDPRIKAEVERCLKEGLLWPDPMIQMNPSYQDGDSLDELVAEKILHPECLNIFRRGKGQGEQGIPLRLYKHQVDAIRIAAAVRIDGVEPVIVTAEKDRSIGRDRRGRMHLVAGLVSPAGADLLSADTAAGQQPAAGM